MPSSRRLVFLLRELRQGGRGGQLKQDRERLLPRRSGQFEAVLAVLVEAVGDCEPIGRSDPLEHEDAARDLDQGRGQALPRSEIAQADASPSVRNRRASAPRPIKSTPGHRRARRAEDLGQRFWPARRSRSAEPFLIRRSGCPKRSQTYVRILVKKDPIPPSHLAPNRSSTASLSGGLGASAQSEPERNRRRFKTEHREGGREALFVLLDQPFFCRRAGLFELVVSVSEDVRHLVPTLLV